ncbi:MAG: Ig-like domain-containing protein [Mogibacterium sp.]|nr:Ig-like domain-containing protein [Mogibacterium sp.]
MKLKNMLKRVSAVFIITALLLSCFSMGAGSTFARAASSKISISPKKLSMEKGDKKKLKVKYKSAKLKKKTVKWSSSDKSIATVSKKGVVKAKSSGTVTITAKVGKHKAKARVSVKKKDDAFIDVSDAYKYLNDFRTKEGVWQWNEKNKSKTFFNTAGTTKLEPLKRDAALEKTAEIRAKEIVKLFDHTRPNGDDCFGAYPEDLTAMGENIAAGFNSARDVTDAWIEENEKYEGQGHRRNMLSKDFTLVGIAGYKHNGVIYWVQCFGRR